MIGSKPDLAVEMGFDEFAYTGETFHADIFNLKDNSRKGKIFPGGPTCEFKGKKFQYSLSGARVAA